jgi:putative endonuclease
MEGSYYVYIMASKRNGALYVGSTNDLVRRAYQHRKEFKAGFTKRYHVTRLVYYEGPTDFESARKRERLLKRWKRKWKLKIIEDFNSNWDDLYLKINT